MKLISADGREFVAIESKEERDALIEAIWRGTNDVAATLPALRELLATLDPIRFAGLSERLVYKRPLT